MNAVARTAAGLARNRDVWLLVAGTQVCIALWFTLPISRTVDALIQASAALPQRASRLQESLRTPGSGRRETLPSTVLDMVSLLERNHVESFQLSPSLSKYALLYQRTVEGVWPRRLEPSSRYKIVSLGEVSSDPAWIEKDRGREVALVICR